MILNEEKIIRKQLIKNMMYNFIVFSIIFTLFGIIIFNAVKNSIYQSSNTELKTAMERLSLYNGDRNPRLNNMNINKENRDPNNMKINPRVTYILRDENYNIINSDNLGRMYEDYSSSLIFDANNLEKIYEIQLANKYIYRGLNIKIVDENNEIKYIQLLINVDAEKAIVDNYFNILIVGIAITIILSIIASYILSKRALKPIIETWKKQTEFVQNASHELRTPLTIIQAKQELLLQEPNSKIIDKSEDIMLTLNEAKRLSKMTKDLMILARADSDNIEFQKEEVEIDKLIKEISMPYIDFANLENKKVILNLDYNTKVNVDANKMHQLMIILLDNAIKYTKPDDNIEIHTYQKDNKCIIEVKDTGIGISDEGLKHAFDRFYREDKARSRKTGGTGLGLSIAQYIVQAHKGSIKIEHNNPKGIIVIIKLPKI